MPELTIADVDQAEARLLEAKAKGRSNRRGTKSHDEYQQVAQEVADLRRAYRIQEEEAGRRSPVSGPGEDAQEG